MRINRVGYTLCLTTFGSALFLASLTLRSTWRELELWRKKILSIHDSLITSIQCLRYLMKFRLPPFFIRRKEGYRYLKLKIRQSKLNCNNFWGTVQYMRISYYFVSWRRNMSKKFTETKQRCEVCSLLFHPQASFFLGKKRYGSTVCRW